MTNRRDFLALSTALLASHSLTPRGFTAPSSGLKILILGGTGFIGPHQIEYALKQGHQVTIFNRGRNPSKFSEQIESLVGNRDPKVDDGLSVLQGKRIWDVVIDNSGYVPRHVQASINLLKKRCGRYIYVSSISSYDFDQGNEFAEDAPLVKKMDTEEVTGESYGALKAECDRVVIKTLDQRGTIVRPDYIVGPGDHTDRFTYWVNRVYRGGEVLAPNAPKQRVSWVDVRDLCPWLIELGAGNVSGIYNASGPSNAVSREGLLWGLRAATSAPVSFFWPSEDFLQDADVHFPICGTYKELSIGNQASIDAGLTYRSLVETATAIQNWWETQTSERRGNPQGWLSSEREAELIKKLKQG